MINDHNMEYNSQKTKLIIPEYGRNVQMLIKHAKTIEDDEYRQAFVERVVQLMMQMHPQNKNIEDYRNKMWMHVFRIADYDLKVVPPNGHIPTADEAASRPEIIGYPAKETRFRHYGHHVKTLIKKARKLEDDAKKREFALVIGSYMKLAYRTWMKEHYVSDEVIREDLKSISKGELVLEDSDVLNAFIGKKVTKKGPNSLYSKDRDRDYDKKKRKSGGYRKR